MPHFVAGYVVTRGSRSVFLSFFFIFSNIGCWRRATSIDSGADAPPPPLPPLPPPLIKESPLLSSSWYLPSLFLFLFFFFYFFFMENMCRVEHRRGRRGGNLMLLLLLLLLLNAVSFFCFFFFIISNRIGALRRWLNQWRRIWIAVVFIPAQWITQKQLNHHKTRTKKNYKEKQMNNPMRWFNGPRHNNPNNNCNN